MSFYYGLVAKLTRSSDNPTVWDVVDLLSIDTDSDENIHINFSHKHIIRAVFVPVTAIRSFDAQKTKKVKRTFSENLEIWESQ